VKWLAKSSIAKRKKTNKGQEILIISASFVQKERGAGAVSIEPKRQKRKIFKGPTSL